MTDRHNNNKINKISGHSWEMTKQPSNTTTGIIITFTEGKEHNENE